jgi:hypothetical protein
MLFYDFYRGSCNTGLVIGWCFEESVVEDAVLSWNN